MINGSFSTMMTTTTTSRTVVVAILATIMPKNHHLHTPGTMMMIRLFFFLGLLSCQIIPRIVVQADQGCWLCNESAKTPTDWAAILPDGQSCTDYYVSMYQNMGAYDSECADAQDYVSECCCSDSVPDSCYADDSSSSPAATTVEKTGNNPVCNVCGTEEYPGNPYAYIQIRYLGFYSCDGLYYEGLKGEVDDYLCLPIQDYVYDVCGCGEYNPACQEDASQCWENKQKSSSSSGNNGNTLFGHWGKGSRGGSNSDLLLMVLGFVLAVGLSMWLLWRIRNRISRKGSKSQRQPLNST